MIYAKGSNEFVAHKGSVCGVQFMAINMMALIYEDLRRFSYGILSVDSEAQCVF
jgi:hypothetical protein